MLFLANARWSDIRVLLAFLPLFTIRRIVRAVPIFVCLFVCPPSNREIAIIAYILRTRKDDDDDFFIMVIYSITT